MATIASLLDLPQNSTRYEFLVEQLRIPAYDIPETEMIFHLIGSESPWYNEFYTYLHDHTLPPNQSNNQCKTFIRQTAQYTIIVETLYWCSLGGTLLRCLEQDEIKKGLGRGTWRNLWNSCKRSVTSQETPTHWILLAIYGKRLLLLCQKVQEMPSSWRPDTCTRTRIATNHNTMAFLSMGLWPCG